jgi:hypothetical protein
VPIVSREAPEPPSSADARKAAKQAAARAFDHGIRAAGLSNDAVATAMHVGATRVKSLRSDDKGDLGATPNLADLILMDSEVQFEETVARLRAERIALHGPPQLASLEDQLLTVFALDGQFTAEGASALRDRVVDATEIPGIEAKLDASDRERQSLRGMLRRRSVK